MLLDLLNVHNHSVLPLYLLAYPIVVEVLLIV